MLVHHSWALGARRRCLPLADRTERNAVLLAFRLFIGLVVILVSFNRLAGCTMAGLSSVIEPTPASVVLAASRERRAMMNLLPGPPQLTFSEEHEHGTGTGARGTRAQARMEVIDQIRHSVVDRHLRAQRNRNHQGVLRLQDNAVRSRAAIHTELRRRLAPAALRAEYERHMEAAERVGTAPASLASAADSTEAHLAMCERARKAREAAWATRYAALQSPPPETPAVQHDGAGHADVAPASSCEAYGVDGCDGGADGGGGAAVPHPPSSGRGGGGRECSPRRRQSSRRKTRPLVNLITDDAEHAEEVDPQPPLPHPPPCSLSLSRSLASAFC